MNAERGLKGHSGGALGVGKSRVAPEPGAVPVRLVGELRWRPKPGEEERHPGVEAAVRSLAWLGEAAPSSPAAVSSLTAPPERPSSAGPGRSAAAEAPAPRPPRPRPGSRCRRTLAPGLGGPPPWLPVPSALRPTQRARRSGLVSASRGPGACGSDRRNLASALSSSAPPGGCPARPPTPPRASPRLRGSAGGVVQGPAATCLPKLGKTPCRSKVTSCGARGWMLIYLCRVMPLSGKIGLSLLQNSLLFPTTYTCVFISLYD